MVPNDIFDIKNSALFILYTARKSCDQNTGGKPRDGLDDYTVHNN